MVKSDLYLTFRSIQPRSADWCGIFPECRAEEGNIVPIQRGKCIGPRSRQSKLRRLGKSPPLSCLLLYVQNVSFRISCRKKNERMAMQLVFTVLYKSLLCLLAKNSFVQYLVKRGTVQKYSKWALKGCTYFTNCHVNFYIYYKGSIYITVQIAHILIASKFFVGSVRKSVFEFSAHPASGSNGPSLHAALMANIERRSGDANANLQHQWKLNSDFLF